MRSDSIAGSAPSSTTASTSRLFLTDEVRLRCGVLAAELADLLGVPFPDR